MARHKVLKGVAHNIGHSFTSLMNYADDDYVMSHILNLARKSGRDTLTIDLLTGQANPSELIAAPISGVPSHYAETFRSHVVNSGSDPAFVKKAELTLRYDLSIEYSSIRVPEVRESPYVCDVRIEDDRGISYEAHFRGWWYPEKIPSKLDVRSRLNNWIRGVLRSS